MNIHASVPAPVVRPISALPQADYVAITPYLLPPGTSKKINVGDGFILDSAVKLIGARPHTMISNRAPLSEADVERINASRCLLAIGANTLKDDFELAPGFNLATLSRLKVPVILMGVGHYGVAEVTRGLKPDSGNLFRAMLERFPFMSVRCDASRDYVVAGLPEWSDAVLMTSCPVAHQVDGIDAGFARKDVYQQLVVTITDRAFLQEQLAILPAAKTLFPAQRRILALHQDYQNAALWKFAGEQGFEVFRSDAYEDFLLLYATTDMHFGNRVHAHLKCLSYGVASFCTPFDLRQTYFAQSLDYPLISQASAAELASYDFGRAMTRRNAARMTMDRFISALHGILR